MITDVSLDASDPRMMASPPDVTDPFIAEVVSGTSTFGRLHVLPLLTIGGDAESLLQGPQPVKTVPAHFSAVHDAGEEDVAQVFGQVEEKQFYIGTPLDMETRVRLDPAELVKRSNGVFGKSGTGKTFLARLVLIGIIQENAAVNLIFDMHSEYGWQGTSEGGGTVRSLKQLFPSSVAVFALDAESARRRKVSVDSIVEIGYDEIEPEDVAMLRETLGLTEAAVQATYRLARRFGDRQWLQGFLSIDSKEDLNALAEESGSWCPTPATTPSRAYLAISTAASTWCSSSVATPISPPICWWPTCSRGASTRSTASAWSGPRRRTAPSPGL